MHPSRLSLPPARSAAPSRAGVAPHPAASRGAAAPAHARPAATANRLARVALLAAALLVPSPARAFCGFFVASGNARLFNRASQVVLARDGDRTVLTMANDFKGEPKEFALVVPVPTVLERGQIHVADRAAIDHLDAYSAPRLVEYYDDDPCRPQVAEDRAMKSGLMAAAPRSEATVGGVGHGVTIEAKYTVGEYDILILSAKQSDGLAQWLVENGYRIPPGAARVLGGYLRQGMKFFVAKVNLKEQARLGFANLRPLQMAYESPRFMLPIRLGMVNADGPQELLVYALTRTGRVETANYRSVKLPSDLEVPLYVAGEFPVFYKAMFGWQTKRERMGVVFTEYAWDMSWCDPCASAPLSNEELKKLGVFWLDDPGGARTFVTRLHARYDRAHFPEDLVFQTTGDTQNFQGRYILRHPWTGDLSCPAAQAYKRELAERRAREAKNLAELTGWNPETIRARMQSTGEGEVSLAEPKWWEKLWPGENAAK